MILVTGTIRVGSESVLTKVRQALINRAVRSRGDEGCLDYNFATSFENPLEIRLIEVWQNEELLQAHLQIPDPEFSDLLANVEFESAIVTANEVSGSRTLLER